MNMQNVSNLQIPEGMVKTIHDKNSQLLWGAVGYNTKYAGDTYQQTYSGKNLAKTTDCDISGTGYSMKITNGSVDLSTRSHNGYFDLCSGTRLGNWAPSYSNAPDAHITGATESTYTISWQDFSISGSAQPTSFYVFTNQRQILASVRETVPTMSPITLASGEYIKSFGVWMNGNNTDSTTKFKVQIEQNSTATSYEPYCGGIPSPNPDYPQDIQVVTGEQTVTISDGTNSEDYKVNLTSKNLFDMNNTSGSYRTTKEIIGNSVKVTSTIDGNGYTAIMIPNSDSLLGKSCTLSFTAEASVNDGMVRIFQAKSSAPATLGGSVKTIQGSGYLSDTFTFPNSFGSGFDCFVVLLYPNNGYEAITTGDYAVYSNLQIEEGSTDTPFTPYFTPIELAKIGTYQDYIYKSGDDWYVYKEIGDSVLKGTEDWILGQSLTNTSHFNISDFTTIFTGAAVPPNDTILGYCLSDHFEEKANLYNIDQVGIDFHSNKNLIVSVPNSISTTTVNFKTWLASNNTVVYYRLATPTDTKITDSILISQLNAVHQWLVRYGYNATVTGNLPIVIDRTNL